MKNLLVNPNQQTHELRHQPMSWKYIAGFFDGEGCVTKTNGKYRVILTQVGEEVLKDIVIFMGFGILRIEKHVNPAHQDCGRITIASHEDQEKFASNVLPYSIVKKKALIRLLVFIRKKHWYADNKLRNVNKAKLAFEYSQGVSGSKLAERYGVTRNAIYWHLKKNGVKIKSSSDYCLTVNRPEIVSRYVFGEDMRNLAHTYGVCEGTIRYHLIQAGIHLPIRRRVINT